MNKLPKITSYGEYSSYNHGVNSLMVEIGDLILYFSYQTVIAFRAPLNGLVVSENAWSTTTGKHLNWIDGGKENKKERLPRVKFETKLYEVLRMYDLVSVNKDQ